jgi:hypothetical protein
VKVLLVTEFELFGKKLLTLNKLFLLMRIEVEFIVTFTSVVWGFGLGSTSLLPEISLFQIKKFKETKKNILDPRQQSYFLQPCSLKGLPFRVNVFLEFFCSKQSNSRKRVNPSSNLVWWAWVLKFPFIVFGKVRHELQDSFSKLYILLSVTVVLTNVVTILPWYIYF